MEVVKLKYIIICGSMAFKDEMIFVKKELDISNINVVEEQKGKHRSCVFKHSLQRKIC